MLAVTSVMKDREWILPYFLSCVYNLAYPREETCIILYDDASTDNTRKLLEAFRSQHESEYAAIRILHSDKAFDNNTSSRDPQNKNRQEIYSHLADLRNIMIDEANALGCTWQFSVDSDIIFTPDIVNHLMQYQKPYVATIIINDNHVLNYFNYTNTKNRHVNFGNITFKNDKRYFTNYPYDLNKLYAVDVSGACYLINNDVLKSSARYGFDELGEDVSYCLQLKDLGFQVSVETTVKAIHTMLPQYLEKAIPVFQTLLRAPDVAQENCAASLVQPEDLTEITAIMKQSDEAGGNGERQAYPTLSGFRADHVARYEFASSLIEPGFTVLDMACGVGYGSFILSQNENCQRVVAIDNSEKAIEYADKFFSSPKVEHRLGDCLEIDLKEEAFDLVVAFETVEHLKDDAAFLQRLHRILKPSGTLVLSTSNELVSPYSPMNSPFHVRHYTPDELRALIARSGFKLISAYAQPYLLKKVIIPGWDGGTNIVVCVKQ
ncbi:MAG TPA: methyltransferase domain-containing protein [Armatimonadota bacterium]|nr:methyltransferase domain-containing protein [Armatimonadota bacterium]